MIKFLKSIYVFVSALIWVGGLMNMIEDFSLHNYWIFCAMCAVPLIIFEIIHTRNDGFSLFRMIIDFVLTPICLPIYLIYIFIGIVKPEPKRSSYTRQTDVPDYQYPKDDDDYPY